MSSDGGHDGVVDETAYECPPYLRKKHHSWWYLHCKWSLINLYEDFLKKEHTILSHFEIASEHDGGLNYIV
jgi:hypothetical protein